jgi:hypothetical protein
MRRSTVVMLVLLAILAGLYWYMQQPDNIIQRAIQPTPTATPINLGTLIGPEKGQAVRIAIAGSGEESISLDHSQGIWMLVTAEDSVPADPNAVDLAASALLDLRILNQLDSLPNPASILLDPPAYRISISMSDGSKVNFNVGAKTVTKSGYYVQTADGNVYVVAAYGIDSLLRLVSTPPYLQTPTSSPLPATETPVPSATPQPSATQQPGTTPEPTP